MEMSYNFLKCRIQECSIEYTKFIYFFQKDSFIYSSENAVIVSIVVLTHIVREISSHNILKG